MNPKTKPSRRRFAAKDAYTLVELMIASVLLTITGVGTLSGLLQSRRLTEGSIHLATATTVAQGYIEQIKNMEFSLLDRPVIDELISQGQSDSLVVSPLPANPELGNDATDRVNARRIDINNTPDDTADDLAIDFVVYIEDITDPAAGVSDARRVILRWSYQDQANRSGNTIGNTLYTIRSRVPTF